MPDDILWNMSFYGMLASVILPLVMQSSRPYTLTMDSLYLLFSQDIMQMFGHWNRVVTEPFKYLAGQQMCQHYLLGSLNQVECHIVFSQTIFSLMAVIGYAIGLPADYMIYQGTTLPSLQQR